MNINIQNDNFIASIDSFGAELKSFNKNNFNYIWTVNENYWNKTSPVLFPIVGGLKDNSFFINDKKYAMSRHGFARDYNFEVIKKSESSVLFSLKNNNETLKQYPFAFELQIQYTLEANRLIIAYHIQNNSEQKMPFNIGAHPAFSIDGFIEDYKIIFDEQQDLVTHQLDNGIFSGITKKIPLIDKTLNLNYTLFENDALVFKNIKSKSLTIFKNNQSYLKIRYKNFPHLGIWTKKGAPFLCIEPWNGYADSINSNQNIYEKESIEILEPNQVFHASFSIEIT
jgi:galactose mutarotase-like enzyme